MSPHFLGTKQKNLKTINGSSPIFANHTTFGRTRSGAKVQLILCLFREDVFVISLEEFCLWVPLCRTSPTTTTPTSTAPAPGPPLEPTTPPRANKSATIQWVCLFTIRKARAPKELHIYNLAVFLIHQTEEMLEKHFWSIFEGIKNGASAARLNIRA
jgi:hypothetical protein